MPYLGGNSSNSVFKSFFLPKILVYPKNPEKNPKKSTKIRKNTKNPKKTLNPKKSENPKKSKKSQKNSRTPSKNPNNPKNPKNPKKSKKSEKIQKIKCFFLVIKIRSPYLAVNNSSNSLFKSFFIHKILVYPKKSEKIR